MHNSQKAKTTSLMVLLVSVFLLSALAGVGKVSAAGYTEYTGTLGGGDFAVRFPDPWNGMLIVFCRGYSPTPINATAALAMFNASVNELLNQGFAVAASGYGAVGFCIQKGVNSTYELANYVIGTYHVTGKVFLWGNSMGGAVALLLGEKYPNIYSGVLDLYGVKDLKEQHNITMFAASIELETGGTPTTQPTAYEDRSPTYHANITIPVITVHGTSDTMVPFYQSTMYQTAVANTGHSNLYRLYSVTGVGHLSPVIAAQVPSRFAELVAWSNALTGADWPMFHHDLQHSGYSTSPAPSTNQTLWSYTTGASVYSAPAVTNGVVYVGSLDNNVYALDAATGAKIWNYTTGSQVYSSPAVADGKVYVGSSDYKVYCLNAATGALIWNYTTSGRVGSSPAVSDDRVFVGSDDNNVYCLNAATGALIWNYTTGGDVFSNPAVADGKVYVGSKDDKIYCLNAVDGALLWNYTTGNDVLSSPAVANGRVFVGSNDKNFYCLDAATGAKIWNYTTSGDLLYSSPAVADDKVYMGSPDKNVYCLNAADGALIWNYTTGSFLVSSPAVADGRVYVGSDDKKVYCLNAATGALIWNYITGSAIESSPAVANGVVYIGSYDKKVYAFSAGPPIPEGLTIGVMMLLATVAVIISTRYFRKRPKIEN
jgi:outer membrane protein assembly factor BamB/pimeloyl-ACP methyl ester carboxylesterase